MTDWQSVMSSYHNAKFPVIPLTEMRTPFHKDWSKWNTELPDEVLYKPQQRGIGILPGPESGVMIVDIDTKDEALLKTLKELLPSSPVQRFGSKGVGVVYAYNHKLTSRKFKHIQVELFVDSGYVVIPPSHHNKTGQPYKWLGAGLLDIAVNDLPSFGLDVVNRLEQMDAQYAKDMQSEGKKVDAGRHNTLLAQAFKALHSGKDEEKIAQELAWYDLNRHEVSWFKEEMKAKSDDDVVVKARSFVDSAKKTFDKKNPITDDEQAAVADVFEIKEYPKTTGLIGLITELIEESSYTKVPNMAFGSALAILSTIVGNNYSFEGVSPNLFCLLLADSGTGKKFGIEVAKNLLADSGRIGSANYVSSGAIISNLNDYCIRLDVSDEFSKVLKLIRNGGVWQQGMPQELCDLWSASCGQLMNNSAKKGDKAQQPVITRPFVSILAATTISEFKLSVNKSLFTSGLLPRCLFFLDKSSRDNKTRLNKKKVDSLTKDLREHIATWMAAHPVDQYTGKTSEFVMKLSPEVLEMFDQKMNQFHLETFDQPEGSMEKVILTRKREFYKKLALLHAIGRVEQDGLIRKVDLDWAEEVFNCNMINQQSFVNEAAAENEQHANKERLFGVILQNPYISKFELTNKTQAFGKKQRDALLEDLIDSKRVKMIEKKNDKNGKIAKLYFAVMTWQSS